MPCVIGSCPLGREGPLGCHDVPYLTITMQSVCSPIARCRDSMHSIGSKANTSLGKVNVEFLAVKAVELLFKKDVAFQDAMCLHVISRAGTC